MDSIDARLWKRICDEAGKRLDENAGPMAQLEESSKLLQEFTDYLVDQFLKHKRRETLWEPFKDTTNK